MECFNFKVRRPDGAVSVARLATSGMPAVWAIVADLARRVEQVDSRIIVTNDDDEVLIFVGVATALAYPVAKKALAEQAPISPLVGKPALAHSAPI